MQFLIIARTIVDLLPVIIDAMKAVEAAIPGEGKGEQKLAMVRGILEGAYVAADDTANEFEKLWPAVARAIAGVVAAFNAAGIFKK